MSVTEATSTGLPRRVLLTGASRGIGRAIARALLAEGVELALVGRERATLQAVAAGAPGHALLVADLERADDAEACVERAADALGGLDAFVACAGIAEHAPLGTIGRQALERQLAVNFVAPFLMAQRAAEHIAGAGGGSILLIASTLGLAPAATTAAYAASKAALISMTRSFALELGARGVRVNAIAPGVVDTDMVRALRLAPGEAPPTAPDAEGRVRKQLEALAALHPLGRLGQPEEVAETALYLLRAPYVTGAIVAVDGGLLLGQGKP
jgi:NAD(P)-dependent dehydrogenase (short-subunit alcohol dehydrogenase family)